MPDTLRHPAVLQVLPALGAGGVERGTVEMVQAIVQAGGRALVASAGGALAARIGRLGGTHLQLPLDSKNPWTVWRNAGRLARLIRAERVDLVHARSRAPAWSAWLACRRTGTMFLTTWHGSYGEGFPGKRLYNSVMARGALVIAISRHVAGQIMQRHGLPAARLRVIPRGVDTEMFDPAKVSGDRVVRLARQWRLLDGQSVILLPGRLTRWKGQLVAIEALALIKRRDVFLVLAGSEQGRKRYLAEVLRLAVRRGVGAQVRVVGECADMPAAMQLADIVLSASTAPEGFGRVVIEAQAMGRLVVASGHGGAAETVEHGATGFLVPPADPRALADMLDAVLALPGPQRAAVGEAARASVRARYTTAAMQRATLDVYDELLAGG